MTYTRKLAPVLVAAAFAGGAVPATAAAREFEGTIVSVNRDNRTFRIHDSERGTKRIKVNRNTRFERIAGFSALRKGMRNIEVTTFRKTNGRWVATEVERSGGGGDHGGGDD
ncbi:MAG TPA: DUF5666 domain-containing protein [Solirubrobacteraceae bacterium]|nr:DUF5666 domain-containing protein [Solirubrobacteraceae bacterium]